MTQSSLSAGDIDTAFRQPKAAAEAQPQPGDELKRLLSRPINHVPIDPQSGKLVPEDFAQVYLVAQYLYDNGLLPDSYTKNRDAKQAIGVGMAAILQGRKFNMDPFESVKWHYPVRTNLTIWGDAVPGVVKAALRKNGEWVTETEKYEGDGDKLTYTITVKHTKGDAVLSEKTRSFSIADAKAAGLLNKGPWQTSPKRMLLARARTYAYRDAFPELMMGLTVTEEAQDAEVEKDAGERKTLDERLAEAAGKPA